MNPLLQSVLCLVLVCVVTAQAQRHEPVNIPSVSQKTPIPRLDPDKAITQYIHQVWQTEQGLPQNSALTLCQTRNGYLWIGTFEGLVRYDGVRSVVFDKSNTPAIRHNYIMSLLEDREGALWIGTMGGGLSPGLLSSQHFKKFHDTIGIIFGRFFDRAKAGQTKNIYDNIPHQR